MVVVFVSVAACVVLALFGRGVAATAQRMRSWYRRSVEGSAMELVALAALVGGLLGELLVRMRR